jgi:putative ABC transport system permease protein
MDALMQDVRTTLRTFLRRRGFAVAVVLTTALGIAITTAMFSVVHQTLLSPLPYPDADRLAFISKDLISSGYQDAPLAPPEVADVRDVSSSLEGVGSIWATSATLVEDGGPQPLAVGMVTGKFFSVLRVPALRGRWFNDEDSKPIAPPAVIISERLWQSRFGGADVLGRKLRFEGGFGLDSGAYTVIGVMPADFEMLLPPESRVPRTLDVWVPLYVDLAAAPRNPSFMTTVGRLAPGANFEAVNAQLAQLNQRSIYVKASRHLHAVSLRDTLVMRVRPALLILQGVVALVLLIAVAGVAGLVVVRAQERRAELALRVALGGSRRRLASLLLTETLLLAAMGGVIGVALSSMALRWLLLLVDVDTFPIRIATVPSWPVLAVAAACCLVPATVFGLAPLFLLGRRVAPVIGRASRSSESAQSQRLRRALVLGECAVTVVLLIVAGLLIRSFRNLQAVDPGYRSSQVLTFLLALPPERYSIAKGHLARFSRDLERELRDVPGVEAIGAVNQLPLDESVGNATTGYRTRATEKEENAPVADVRLVSPGYFQTVQATLVAGRWFTEQDDENHPLVLLVDERMARAVWPGADPLDQELNVRVWTPDGFKPRWAHVVGVVRHLRQHRLPEEVREEIFLPFAQAPRNQMGVLVRSAVAPDHLMRDVATRLARIDPNLAPARIRTFDAYVERSRAPFRLNMTLATLFAGLSLFLASVSLYGLMSYSVSQRIAELSVRAALGADRRALMRLVVGEGLALIAGGMVVGLVAAFGAVRWLKSLLFGVAALDPVTFIAAPLLLGLVTLLACYVPARRTAAVDPAQALRTE